MGQSGNNNEVKVTQEDIDRLFDMWVIGMLPPLKIPLPFEGWDRYGRFTCFPIK